MGNGRIETFPRRNDIKEIGRIDAVLRIARVLKPNESDGECNGGPKAGQWFNDRALDPSRNAKF